MGRLGDRTLREMFEDPWAGRIALFLLAVPLLFGGMASEPLASTDTALHAAIARRMAAGSPWLTPVFRGQPWFEHFPPFLWIAAASFRAFGFSAWAGRLPGLTLGLITVLVVFEIARAEGQGTFAATCAGVVLVTTELFWRHAARIRPDMLLVASIAVAILAMLRARRSPRWYLVFGAATGLAIFAKGPMGVAPLAVLIALSAVEPTRLSSGWLYAGLLLIVLVPLPWVSYQLARDTGWYERYVLHQMVALPLEGDGSKRDPTFGLRYIATTYWPWLPFLLLAIARSWRQALVPLMWAGFVVVAVAISAKHPDYYLLPAYPAFALLVARALSALFARWSVGITVGFASLGVAVALVLAVTPISARRSDLEVESRKLESISPAVAAAAAEGRGPVGLYDLHPNRAAWCLEMYTDLPAAPVPVTDAALATFTSTTGRLLLMPEEDVANLPSTIAAHLVPRAHAAGLTLLETR